MSDSIPNRSQNDISRSILNSIVDIDADLKSSVENLHKSEEKIKSDVILLMEQGLKDGNIRITDMLKQKEIAKLHLDSFDIHAMISRVELSQLEELFSNAEKNMKVYEHSTPVDVAIAKIHNKLIKLKKKKAEKQKKFEYRMMNRIRNGEDIDPDKVNFQQLTPADNVKIYPYHVYKKNRAKIIKSANLAYVEKYVQKPDSPLKPKNKIPKNKDDRKIRTPSPKDGEKIPTEEEAKIKRRNAVITSKLGGAGDPDAAPFQMFTEDLNQLWEEEDNIDYEIKRIREKWGSAYNCREYLMKMRRKNPNFHEEKKVIQTHKPESEGKNYIVITPNNFASLQQRKKNTTEFVHPATFGPKGTQLLHPMQYVDIPSRSSSEASNTNSNKKSKKKTKYTESTQKAVIIPKRDYHPPDYKLETFGQSLATESKTVPKVVVEKEPTESFRRELTETIDFQLPLEAQGIKNYNSFITSKDRLEENKKLYHSNHRKNIETFKKKIKDRYKSTNEDGYGNIEVSQPETPIEMMNTTYKTPKGYPGKRLYSAGGVTNYDSTRKPSSSGYEPSARYHIKLNQTISPGRSSGFESPIIDSPERLNVKALSQRLNKLNRTLDYLSKDKSVTKKSLNSVAFKNKQTIDKIENVYEEVSRLREYNPHILQAVYKYNMADAQDRADEVEEMIDKVRGYSLALNPAMINFQKRVLKTQYRVAMQKKMDIKFGKEYN